jgi:ASC-1-like (ASCH) protein
MKILHLNLYRKYFDLIAEGTKTIEYRDKTDYWKRRIEDKEYDVIKFRNGYRKDAPTMVVEYGGWNLNDDGDYELYLGEVLKVNYNES